MTNWAKLTIVAVACVICHCWASDRGTQSDSRNANLSSRTRLTAGQFQEILSSEVDNEISSSTSSEEFESIWDEAAVFERNRASNITRRSRFGPPPTFPYVICESSGSYGFERRLNLEPLFGSYIMPLYNKESMTCFLAQTTTEDAENSDRFIIHPLTSSMKIRGDTLAFINNSTCDDNLSTEIVIDICPLVSASLEDTKTLIGSFVNELKANDSTGRSTISNEFFWSSYANERRSRARRHQRANYWSNIMNSQDTSHKCKDFYEKMQIDYSKSGQKVSFKFVHTDTETPCLDCMLRFVAHFASQRQICSIDHLPEIELFNHEAQWITQSGEDDWRPWFDVGLKGKNQVVAVSDTGIDLDNCYFWDSSNTEFEYRGDSFYPNRRKVIQYVPFVDTTDPFRGHGTHVCGTVAGKKSSDGKTESSGIADGIAPDAKIAFCDIGDDSQYIYVPLDVDDLFGPGRKIAGANIHSGSWGSRRYVYGTRESDYDLYSYENEDFLTIFAAGNYGANCGTYSCTYDKLKTVISPSLAKNTISVGASHSSGSDIHYIAYFSSRGTTADGRIKPEIVAPGFWILSASANPSNEGDCGTTNKAGTSMAAPVVAGSAALIRQYFKEGWYPTGEKKPEDTMTPSSALVKAVLLNGAQPIIAVQNGNSFTPSSPYDIHQGFGRVSLIHSLYLKGQNDVKAKVIDRKEIYPLQVDTYDVVIDKSGGCTTNVFSATIVWTDPPGVAGCRACLLNDLDLRVQKIRSDGTNSIHYPNGLNNKDAINNVERIQVNSEHGDKFQMEVTASNLETEKQKYALVMTGCIGNVNESTISPAPTSNPTSQYTPIPSNGPSQQPTSSPTAHPTASPSVSPTVHPTASPTTVHPTSSPTVSPTTVHPTSSPTVSPTTVHPTSSPTVSPTTIHPTSSPTAHPSSIATSLPTSKPTLKPNSILNPTTSAPISLTSSPSSSPLHLLTPTIPPTSSRTSLPTSHPKSLPSYLPTLSPTSHSTGHPSFSPTSSSTVLFTKTPTPLLTLDPAVSPTSPPTLVPSSPPSLDPTTSPTSHLTLNPTVLPTSPPTLDPTPSPTPTLDPTASPTSPLTLDPTVLPTSPPTLDPTPSPTAPPTLDPTASPTSPLTINPTVLPTSPPTLDPTPSPTAPPTLVPTASPTSPLTSDPTSSPTSSAPPPKRKPNPWRRFPN